MALYDIMYEFMDDLTITTTNGTTIGGTAKTIDWQAADLEMGAGEPLWLNVRVGTTAITGTTIDIRLLADTAAGGQDSSSLIVLSSGARTIGASIAVGEWLLRVPLPVNVDDRRFLAVAVVATGTVTGALNAWLDHGPQSSYDTQVSTSNI
ncbi:hypothetical protein LCGC14_0345710 [marine sediment metagenome]|uniref:PLAT domain-containing protein n=1 Tax=marine sediment metagenome TaxID=412755 RepID=A0A0F9THU4_9ZZZZ